MPYPPNKGEKSRSDNMLEFLTAQHDVYLGSLIDDTADLQLTPEVKARVREFVFSTIRASTRKLAAFPNIVRSQPISVSYFYSKRLQRDIDDLIERIEFDAVLCFSSPMAEYLFRSRHWNGKLRRTTRVMDLIDVDSYKWVQYAQRASGLMKWIYHYEARHLAAYESKISDTFKHILVVSDREKQIFEDRIGGKNVAVMANGVDLAYFSPGQPGQATDAGPNIVFTGVMDYWPNIEGARWFAADVFPQIRRAAPKATFYVVGSKPTAEVKRLEQLDGVKVTGFVDDIRQYIGAAAVCVVPLRIARGIQNKVLEAMAMGRPVVSTSQALEGIKAVAGHDLLQADNADSFAEAVIELLRNREKAESLGRSARRCVEQFYAWDQNLSVLDKVLSRRDSAVS